MRRFINSRMRSTNVLTLPNALRRAELRSFCSALSIITIIVLALITRFSGTLTYVAAAIVCLCVVGLLSPQLVRLPYRIWNKSAKLYAHYACVYIMAVSFQLIVRLIGAAARQEEQLKSSPSSSWVQRDLGPAPAYGSQYQISDEGSVRAHWPIAVLRWAWRTGNLLAVFLLPFLMMIALFQPDEEASNVSDIYTLF